MADERAWLPDGQGLDPLSVELVAERNGRVHLRLTSQDGCSSRGACDGGLGEWWTGVAREVNCPACLEVVHA